MAVGGEAVAVGPAGVVLVPGAAPGEHVRIEDVRRSGGVLRGRLGEVLSPSEVRVEPPCPLASTCGGCPWMHLDVEARRAYKAGFLAEALRRAGHERTPRFHASPTEIGWRRRARLTWRGPSLGFRGRRSKAVVDVPRCLVLTPALQRGLDLVRSALSPALGSSGWMTLVEGAQGVSVVVHPDDLPSPGLFGACEGLARRVEIGGVSLWSPDAGAPATWGAPSDTMPALDGGVVEAHAGGFSQAHAAINVAMVRVVAELADTADASVLELYAGAGNLTTALAPDARRYVAVEADPQASEDCRRNLAARGVQGVRVSAGGAASPPKGRFDVVVLDPPRTGAREALAGVLAARPQRIVYVSCDPPTLGRDLAALGEGWRVTAAHGFDMFPQTAHVEAVVRLDRRR